MKSFIALALLISAQAFAGVFYSDKFDAPKAAKDFRLKSVAYNLLPTKTEIRQIPGCRPYGERHPVDCEQVVVLESQAVIQVHVGYFDPALVDGDYRGSTVTLNFKLEDFEASDVEALKKNYRSWRGIFSRVGERIANETLELKVEKVQRTVMVVDVRNSKLCPIDRNRYPDRLPGCEEILVYRPSLVWVNEVSVLKK